MADKTNWDDKDLEECKAELDRRGIEYSEEADAEQLRIIITDAEREEEEAPMKAELRGELDRRGISYPEGASLEDLRAKVKAVEEREAHTAEAKEGGEESGKAKTGEGE